MLDPSPFTGPIVVTVTFFALWYALLFRQTHTKRRLKAEYESRNETFDRYFGQDRQMLAVDRAAANTQEQMVPFLCALWLHATVVSVTVATTLGSIYVGLRALYPVLLGNEVDKMPSQRVFFATAPAYLIVYYLLGSTVWVALSG
jgi:hypothetical protein